MSRIVQEKFEVHQEPVEVDQPQGWVTDMQARAKKNQPGREGLPGGDYNSRYMANAAFFNTLPPGEDIEDQEVCDIRRMGINVGGGFPTELAQGDRTVDLTQHSLLIGFDRKRLRPTDDMYTREHNDAFYESVIVDGVEGFVERNNMLDRL